MLVQPAQDEGASSERLSVEQPSPSPTPTGEIPNESLPDSSSAQPSEIPFEHHPDTSPSPSLRLSPRPSPTPIVPDSIPEPTGENLGDASSQIKPRKLNSLKAKIKKLKKKLNLSSKHYARISEITTLQAELPKEEASPKKQGSQKECIDKQEERKKAKGNQQKTRIYGEEEKEFDEESTQVLREDEVYQTAILKEKEKGVELKDVEDIDRPRPTSQRSLLTLKHLPKINPKDKGKKKIEEEEESESKDDDIPQVVKKFKQLESDEVLARKIQEDWEAEEERHKIVEETATNEALIKDFDDIQARIEADRILAEKLQEQEREQFSIEERAKFLHDTIAAQVKGRKK
ncbi:hypothetical protein Tco_1053418 [Tanacetum coccineum]